jgi:formate dehydrogenase iron-sulfur subunit
LRFGQRARLLAQAHAQIASNPGRYVDHVYGEHEAGGASVLYLSPLPFAALGFPALGDEGISTHAEAMMERTPLIALTVAAAASALSVLLKRRAAHAEFSSESPEKESTQ